MISVALIGGKELERKLLELEKKVGKKIVRPAVRNAQKVLLVAIKQRLNFIAKGGGMAQKISKALTVRAQKKQKKGSYSINVQLKNDPAFIHYSKGASSSLTTGKTTGKRTYAPAAIEFGHGKNKEQAARPFMRPAADMLVRNRIEILRKEVAAGIAKIWRKKTA